MSPSGSTSPPRPERAPRRSPGPDSAVSRNGRKGGTGRKGGSKGAKGRRRLSRSTGRLVGLAALGLLAVAVLTDIGDPRPSEDTAEEPSSQGTGSASSGPIPDDVDDPRPTVDLTAVPSGEDGADPVTVARWWAATYIAYVGAEPSEAVIARLAPVTTDTLAAALAAIPPPASYDDAPAPIDGVSGRPPTQEDDGIGVRVTVDTGAATVTYDLTLVERPNPGEDQTAWMVNRAERL